MLATCKISNAEPLGPSYHPPSSGSASMLNSNGVLSPPGPEHVRCNCTRTQCAPNGGKTLNSTCNLPYCVQQCTTLVCLSARHTPLTACSAGLFLVQTVLRANLQPLLPQPCTNVSLNSWCTSVPPAAACMSGLFIGKFPIQTSLTGYKRPPA